MNEPTWTALYSRLASGTALTALLASLKGGTTPAICRGQAADGQPMPYLIFTWASGGIDGASPHPEDTDGILRGLAYAETAETAGAVRAAVVALLNRQPLTITGYDNVQLDAEAPHIDLPQIDEAGNTTWLNGDDYRIRLHKQ